MEYLRAIKEYETILLEKAKDRAINQMDIIDAAHQIRREYESVKCRSNEVQGEILC